MDSEELAANTIRVSQTDAKIKRYGVSIAEGANSATYQVGTIVRETLDRLGVRMPESPRPPRSLTSRSNKSSRMNGYA